MSDILCKMLYDKYPPIGLKKVNRVLVYAGSGGCVEWEPNQTWIERIHLNLIELNFIDSKKELFGVSDIKHIAKNAFDDIEYSFYEKSEWNNAALVDFRPHGIDEYVQKYSGYCIAVEKPFRSPKIMISTGNRGQMGLHERQREKYFQFVNEIYDLAINSII